MVYHLSAHQHMPILIITLEQLETLKKSWLQSVPSCTASDATTAEGTLRWSGQSLDCKIVSCNLPQHRVPGVVLGVPLDMFRMCTQSKTTYPPPTNDIQCRLSFGFEILLELIMWAGGSDSLLLTLNGFNSIHKKWTAVVWWWLWCRRAICVT